MVGRGGGGGKGREGTKMMDLSVGVGKALSPLCVEDESITMPSDSCVGHLCPPPSIHHSKT